MGLSIRSLGLVAQSVGPNQNLVLLEIIFIAPEWVVHDGPVINRHHHIRLEEIKIFYYPELYRIS